MKRKIFASASLAALAMMLSGCGDGGVASTPPPTSTPPPGASYTKIVDMSGDRTLQSGGVQYNSAQSGFTNGAPVSFGSGPTIAYSAATDSYTLRASDGTVATFTPVDVVNPTPPGAALQYRKTVGSTTDVFTIVVPQSGTVTLSYLLVGSWIHSDATGSTIRLGVAGSPTIASDMPRSGTATYSGGTGGTAVMNNAGQSLSPSSTMTFSTNFGTGAVTTSLNLASAANNFGTFNGTGTVSSSGPGFSGTLSGANGGGLFSGAFFGPQALEMGYSWYLTGNLAGTPFSAVGTAVGAKQ